MVLESNTRYHTTCGMVNAVIWDVPTRWSFDSDW